MKFQIKPVGTRGGSYLMIVQFDRLLPVLFPSFEAFMLRAGPKPGTSRHPLFQSPNWKDFYALKLAKMNQGRTPFELQQPVDTFRGVLEQLSSLPGLIDVTDVEPYSIGITVSGLFSSGEVALKVASIIHLSFYAEEELEHITELLEESDEVESTQDSELEHGHEALRGQPGEGGGFSAEPA